MKISKIATFGSLALSGVLLLGSGWTASAEARGFREGNRKSHQVSRHRRQAVQKNHYRAIGRTKSDRHYREKVGRHVRELRRHRGNDRRGIRRGGYDRARRFMRHRNRADYRNHDRRARWMKDSRRGLDRDHREFRRERDRDRFAFRGQRREPGEKTQGAVTREERRQDRGSERDHRGMFGREGRNRVEN